MGERFLIDTNAAIDYLAGKLPKNGVNEIERILVDKVGVISIIVKIELLSFSPPNPEDLQIIEALINQCTLIYLDEDIAEKTYLLRREHRIKLPDAIIAATALANQFTLITRNTTDFRNINGLTFINLYEL